MLSRIAAPNWSGPPSESVPSSKTMTILWIVPEIGPSTNDELYATTGLQRSLVHPSPTIWLVGTGELQPTKKMSVVVTMSNRGAPAPQCDPAKLALPSFLMS